MTTNVTTAPARIRRLLIAPDGPLGNNYDSLRILLAMAVIVSHASSVAQGMGAHEPFTILLRGTSLGDLAVGGFFVISGYLVTASWCSSTPSMYLRKRAARILPGFFVACLITILLAIATSTNRSEAIHCTDWSKVSITTVTLRRPVVCAAYTNNPYPSETNASLWTIKYEVGCYAATALLGLAGFFRTGNRTASALLFVAMTISGAVLGYGELARSPLASATRLGAFYAAGTAVYCFRDKLPRSRWVTIGCLVAIAIASVNRFGILLMLPAVGACLVFRFVYAERLLAPRLKKTVGDLSYGMYLYGWPVSQSLVTIFGAKLLGVWLLAGISVLACLPLAYLSWHFVEKPILSLARN